MESRGSFSQSVSHRASQSVTPFWQAVAISEGLRSNDVCHIIRGTSKGDKYIYSGIRFMCGCSQYAINHVSLSPSSFIHPSFAFMPSHSCSGYTFYCPACRVLSVKSTKLCGTAYTRHRWRSLPLSRPSAVIVVIAENWEAFYFGAVQENRFLDSCHDHQATNET